MTYKFKKKPVPQLNIVMLFTYKKNEINLLMCQKCNPKLYLIVYILCALKLYPKYPIFIFQKIIIIFIILH